MQGHSRSLLRPGELGSPPQSLCHTPLCAQARSAQTLTQPPWEVGPAPRGSPPPPHLNKRPRSCAAFWRPTGWPNCTPGCKGVGRQERQQTAGFIHNQLF